MCKLPGPFEDVICKLQLLMVRFGWSSVGLDAQEQVVAIARGTPPNWIVDIPGTEAWALYQAGLAAEPDSTFRADCRPCVDAIAEGEKSACSAKSPWRG